MWLNEFFKDQVTCLLSRQFQKKFARKSTQRWIYIKFTPKIAESLLIDTAKFHQQIPAGRGGNK